MFLRNFLVANFVKYRFHKEWFYIFVFRGHKHAGNSNGVEFAVFEGSLLSFARLDVPIHEAHSYEQRLVGADVREGDVEYLAHPVNHSSAEVCF